VIDAKAALALYRINEKDWENHVKQKSYSDARKRAEEDVKSMKSMSSFVGKRIIGTKPV
jgi:hypothetical protein